MGDKMLATYIDLYYQKFFFGRTHPNDHANASVTISMFSRI